MKKTPSALKWLAEKRARIAGDLVHMEGLLAELQEQVTRLSGELTVLDGTLAIYDSTIDANAIEPIKAWKGRYGPRGAFQQALAELLQARAPEALSSETIALRMMVKFDLRFELQSERYRWQQNSLGRELKRLVAKGMVERLHPLATKEVGYWRWKQEEVVTLEELRTSSRPAHMLAAVESLNETNPSEPPEEPKPDVAVNDTPTKIRFGLLRGKLVIPDDLDAPLPEDIQGLFEGR